AFLHRVELRLDLVRQTEPVQLLLPRGCSDLIIDDDDAVRVQRRAPADDDLPVDQPLVNSQQNDRHRAIPGPDCSRWKSVPSRRAAAAAARPAASAATRM